MLRGLSFGSLTSSSVSASASAPGPNPPPLQGHSTEQTPVTTTQSSPSPDVSLAYIDTVLGNSFKQIRSIIELEVFDPDGNDPPQDQPQLVDGSADGESQRRFLEKLLQPDRNSVRKGLAQLKSNSLTHLASTCFDHSEAAFDLCLRLLQSLNCARIMYAPLLVLLSVLPSDSNHITQSQCDDAFDVFLRFDTHDNPFPSRDSPNFSNMRTSFSELDQQLHRYLGESRSKLRLISRATTGSALCFIATAVGVVAAAVVITTHALVAIAVAAAPVCPVLSHFENPKKKELARLAQLEAARRTLALKHHLDSIVSLVDLLHEAVKADKNSVRNSLKMVKDRYAIQGTVKLLRKRYESLRVHMEDLKTNIYISVNFVNRARSNLLDQIYLHQNA